jgi:hypothetical protein
MFPVQRIITYLPFFQAFHSKGHRRMLDINCPVYFLGYIMEGSVTRTFLAKAWVSKGFSKVFLKIVAKYFFFATPCFSRSL